MQDFPTSGFAVLPFLVVGGPSLIYVFWLYTKAIRVIRAQYPDNYAALGSPCDLLPHSPGSGSQLASQLLLMKLLLFLPKAVPDDRDVRAKLKRVQLIVRLWNIIGLPVVVWFTVEVLSTCSA